MKIITKNKEVSLSFKGFISKAKSLTKKVCSWLKKKAIKYIGIAVAYAHKKIDQAEKWLYLKLEAKFADIEAGLETLTDEFIE